MSTGPREIGTLIVVVLKARNLPNKRHIGKQDPYCSVQLNGEKRRTKAIKRGGQHPEWDEEMRFTVLEDDSEPSAPHGPNGTPPPLPPKREKGPPSIKGGKYMTVACYAEDIREPDFIGESKVDLTEVLTKGETDEWFTIMNKDKYSGEVYLELTFWSNEPAPLKKSASKQKVKKHYGGPGSFVPSNGPAYSSTENINDFSSLSSRLSSSSSVYDNARRESVPPALRPSSSMAKIDLYKAPYETNRSHNSVSSIDSLASDFGLLNVQQQQHQQPPQRQPQHQASVLSRRTSLPAISSAFQAQQPISPSHSGYLDTRGRQYGYDNYSSYPPNDPNAYNYNNAVTPTSTGFQSYPSQNPPSTQPATYHPPYETPGRPSSVYPGNARHPRHSLPAASSGFMPIPTPTPSGFQPVAPQSTGYYPPPVSATPAPGTSQMQQQQTHTPPYQAQHASHPSLYNAHAPPVGSTPTPAPSNFSFTPQQYPGAPGYLPPSASYHSIPPPQQPMYQYQYPSQSGPPEQSYYSQPPQTMSTSSSMSNTGHHPLPPPPPPSSVPPQHNQSVPPPPPQPERNQRYGEQAHQAIPPPPPLSQSGISPGGGQGGSRPLPVPGANQVVRRRHSTIGVQQPGVPPNFTGSQPPVGYPQYSNIPPPPPLSSSSSMSSMQPRPQTVNGSTLPYPPGHQLPTIPGPPPLPPPRAPSRAPSQSGVYPNPPSRHGSLNQSSPVYTSHPSQMQPQASSVYPTQTGQNQPHAGTPPGFSPHQGHQTSPGYPQHAQNQHNQNQSQIQHSMYQHVPPPPPSNYGGATSHTMALAASSFHSSPTQPAYPGPLPVPPQVSTSQSYGYPVANGNWQ